MGGRREAWEGAVEGGTLRPWVGAMGRRQGLTELGAEVKPGRRGARYQEAGDLPGVGRQGAGSRRGLWRTEGCTGGGGGACAPIAAVLPALVQLALVARVPGLAAALRLPPCIEEAAAAIEALQVTGSGSRSCGKDHEGTEPGKEGSSGLMGQRVLGQERGGWGHGAGA